MLGADVVVVEQARFFLRQHHHSAGPVGEAFEHLATASQETSAPHPIRCRTGPGRRFHLSVSAPGRRSRTAAGARDPRRTQYDTPSLEIVPDRPVTCWSHEPGGDARAPAPDPATSVGSSLPSTTRSRTTTGSSATSRPTSSRPAGKRIRPTLTLCAAYAATGRPTGPSTEAAVTGAVAVELVHLGSLYHDDVIDEAETRRGVPSVNARWSNIVAILAGDYLLARASALAASLGADVAGLLAATIGELCRGQVLELQHLFDVDRTEEAYCSAIEGKTASLFATSCRIGGMVSGVGEPALDALTRFGLHLGMCFQIVDDVLDVTANDAELGKPAGQDIARGRLHAPGDLRDRDVARPAGAARPPARRATCVTGPAGWRPPTVRSTPRSASPATTRPRPTRRSPGPTTSTPEWPTRCAASSPASSRATADAVGARTTRSPATSSTSRDRVRRRRRRGSAAPRR